MLSRLLLAFLIPLLLAGWGNREREPRWPHSGAMPDSPVTVKPLSYESITKGTRSYRPIEPMSWGDVNRRVAPPGSLPGVPPAPPARNGQGATPKQ